MGIVVRQNEEKNGEEEDTKNETSFYNSTKHWMVVRFSLFQSLNQSFAFLSFSAVYAFASFAQQPLLNDKKIVEKIQVIFIS